MYAKPKPQFPVIPDRENRCIWMDLGILAYKICVRDYRCEDCPLDIGLRGGDWNASHSPVDCMSTAEHDDLHGIHSFPHRPFHQVLLKRMIGPYFELDRYYSSRHTWIRTVSKDCHLVGIDNTVAAILGVVDEVKLPQPGTKLRTGDILCELRQLDQTFSIASPLCGEVIHVNGELNDHPHRLLSDPMKGGWICAVAPAQAEADLRNCSPGVQALPWLVDELLRIEQKVIQAMDEKKTPLLNTLNDGGEICLNLEEVLSRQDYIKLVESLLH